MDVAGRRIEDDKVVITITLSKDGQSNITCVGNSPRVNQEVANKLMKHRVVWMLVLKVDELLGMKGRLWN